MLALIMDWNLDFNYISQKYTYVYGTSGTVTFSENYIR